MQITHDNDCEHRLGHDCTCGASSYQFDLAEARAEIERLTLLLDLSKKTTEAVLERAEKAEDERDEAIAAAFEAAAQWHDNRVEEFLKQIEENTEYCEREGLRHSEGNAYSRDSILNSRIAARSIRFLTPADARAALEARDREKVREGMKRAADLCDDGDRGGPMCNCRQFILVTMEEEASQ